MLSEEQIKAELEDLMFEYMEHSCQRKFFGHKSLATDLGSWKLCHSHTDKRGIRYDVYRCPLRNQCGCEVSLRVVIGPDFIELQRHGLHAKNSHDNDKSKTLKRVQVTRFVCVHCTQTGHLSRRCLFLSRAAVNQHIASAQAKACTSLCTYSIRSVPVRVSGS